MNSLELTEWLARQLREALSIVEEQAALLALHGVAEYEGDGCSPSLSRRREEALQGGAEALTEAEYTELLGMLNPDSAAEKTAE